MVSVDFILIEIGLLIFAFILIIANVALPAEEYVVLEYVPDAVRGLTTLASILVGFIGFCMAYLYRSSENREIRKELKNRVLWYVAIIMIALLMIVNAYSSLVRGELVSSYKSIIVGLIIIIILFLDTFLFLFFVFEIEKL